MLLVTTGVEFSFNDVMYKQIDGVAMGSPLGPVLANVFVGYCECKIDASLWPSLYFRFVDDSFTYFDSIGDSEVFLGALNTLHPSLRFTCEHEQSSKLSFLDVLVEKTEFGSVTSVYRKPTFTGQYISYDSYCSSNYKVNLVKNLVDRAKRICSPCKLSGELEFLRSVFTQNGYPGDILAKLLSTAPTPKHELIGPARCPVFLCLPWKGKKSDNVSREVRAIIKQTYYAVHFIPVYTTMRSFTVLKDVLPTHHLSHVIYNFECRNCASRYVGRTVQHLSERIKQHTPLHIIPRSAQLERPTRGRPRKQPLPPPTQDLASHSTSPPLAPVAMTKSLPPPAEVDVALATPRVLHADTFASASLAASPAETTTIPTSISTRPRRTTANYTMTYFSTEVPSQRNTQQERETRDGRRRDLIAPRQEVVEEDSASESSDSGECESENDRVSKSGCERVFSSRKSSVYKHLASRLDCCKVYFDSSFSVLCRARHGYKLQLSVLEAVCQRIHKPNLCVQKDSIIRLKLF